MTGVTVYCHATWSHPRTEMEPVGNGSGDVECPVCGIAVAVEDGEDR